MFGPPLHTEDMSGQAAHDSAWTESAAQNVSINTSTHLVCTSNLQNVRLKFPNRSLLTTHTNTKPWLHLLMLMVSIIALS